MGRFAQTYLGLKLHAYQYIIIFLMNLFTTFWIIACRASAKSYLIAIYACCKSILYPNSKIVVASGTKQQAKLIVSEKIRNELMRDSPILTKEIESIKDNQMEVIVKFRNGSTITVVPALESARGNRGTVMIYEECRQIEKKIIDSILSPFLIVRQAPYLKLPEYSEIQELKEEPTEIYISSAWHTSHWMWPLMKSSCTDMLNAGSSFILGMDYSITLKHGIRTRRQLTKEKKKLDPTSWAIEYENRMIHENLNAYFPFELLSTNQRLKKPLYPKRASDMGKSKNPLFVPKQNGEVRVISCDMAFVENKLNDNSIYTCIRGLPESMTYTTQSTSGSVLEVKQGYRKVVSYMEAIQGGDTSVQAIRIKQLFEDFNADYVVLDMRNAGIAVYDLLAKVMYDEERDKEYTPWTCINDENIAKRIRVSGASPVVYAVIANQRMNSDIAMSMRTALVDKKIDLLIAYNDAMEEILPKIPEWVETTDVDAQIFYERPYLETQALITEMTDLVYEILPQTGIIKIEEQGNKRKDRYTSVSYGIYFLSQLENDLIDDAGDYNYVPLCN